MLQTLWSVKGGSGVTVTAAGVAIAAARRSGRALLVDLCGDQPATLGVAEPAGPGVRDWLAATDSPSSALERLVIEVDDALGLLPRGVAASWSAARVVELVAALASAGCPVVVDAGTWPDGLDDRSSEPGDPADDDPASTGPPALARAFATAGSSLLVTRACYLALRRATAAQVRPDGVVLGVEPGRPLDADSVAQVLGAPVVASVHVDPAVARAVDAGVLARRAPRPLLRSVEVLL